MMFYKDYLGIRPDYAPCMTIADINKTPETWLAFYPHESFVEILRSLLKSLEGNNKSIWITGAYGTGKSHASLVIEKLFSDSDERVSKWLELRKSLIPAPVKTSLLAQRTIGVLIVYDVNSDDVDAKNQFLMRLQRGVTKALVDRNFFIPLRGKLEEVIERIYQDGEYFFEQRDKMQSQLSYLHAGIKTAEALAKKLQAVDKDLGLISDAMLVLEARKVYLGLNAEEFLAWINSIIEANNLSKIVYIWDEFSSFMERNKAELKTMEQMGEAAQQGRFYFVPVTHTEISSYMATGSESAKKANDRYNFHKLEMPNETALKLAADALVPNEATKKKWDTERECLWNSVSGLTENYMSVNHSGIESVDFKGVLPLHPMTAFLLKHLSVAIGSNQRSMFNFLNENTFKSFIEKGGLDVPGKQFLTVDHLWNYFVERDDLGINKAIREVRADFKTREKELQPEECRVLKAVLLFSALEQTIGRDNTLLTASVENIVRCFEGDGAMLGTEMVLRNLEQLHCFTIIKGHCERFRDGADQKEVDDKMAALENQFDRQVLTETSAELNRQLKSINYGGRYDIRANDIYNLNPSSINRLENFSEKGGNILVQFILARDNDELLRIPDKAIMLAKHFNDHRIIFVTFPEVHFCSKNVAAWREFIEHIAKRTLATDNASKEVYEIQIDNAKKEWHWSVINATKLVVYKPNNCGDPYIEDLTWGQLKKDWLINYARQCFTAYTDDLSGFNLSAFGLPNALSSWAQAGIEFDKFAKSGAWRTVINTWRNFGISNEDTWFDDNPNHALSKMRDFCKKRYNNTIGAGNPCSIRKLYIDLQRAPFGLVLAPHSAFVMGFVLKSWLRGRNNLQWTDGVTSKTLDIEALAEIIGAVIKDDGTNSMKNEKLICLLSREEKEFINKSSIIFGCNKLTDVTIESALQSIAQRLEQISERVPLWVLPDYIYSKKEPNAELMRKIIYNLCEANSISSKGDTETRGVKVKEIGAILLEVPELAQAMSCYITPQVFAEAFQYFVDVTRPQLCQMSEELNDITNNYCKLIKVRLAESSSWLWSRGDADAVLDEVQNQMRCTLAMRDVLKVAGYVSFSEALSRLKTAIILENKVPLEFWLKKQPDLRPFFNVIQADNLAANDYLLLEQILIQHKELIQQTFLDDNQKQQIIAIKEIIGDLWPDGVSESRELYVSFPSDSAFLTESDFIERSRRYIEDYNKSLITHKIKQLWEKKTDTKTPDDWSKKHKLPAACLLKNNGSHAIVDIICNPNEASSERVQYVYDILMTDDIFADIDEARRSLLSRILPDRYIRLDFDPSELCAWLYDKLGPDANQWLNNCRLTSAIEDFVKQCYDAHFSGKALAKIDGLSDVDAKSLLRKMVKALPDAGLLVLELKNDAC